jgi:pimeloyl-ACP methyl ester carboxylesterase
MDVKPETNPNGKAVILIHGKNFYGSYWAQVISYLVDNGYRVIVPDQIGFGKSAKPDIHYNFDALAKSNIELLNHLGIEKAIVVGHSMGGMLAVRLARLYPNSTEKLILENPVGLEDYRLNIPPVPLEKLINNELQQTNESIRSFMKRYVVKWDPQVYEPFVDIRTRIMGSAEFPGWAKSSALSSRMMYEQPVLYEFPYVKAPTLLVIGQNDRTIAGRAFAPKEAQETMGFYPELGRKAAKSFPNATLVELENVGHIPHLEAPDIFHKAIGKFIKE